MANLQLNTPLSSIEQAVLIRLVNTRGIDKVLTDLASIIRSDSTRKVLLAASLQISNNINAIKENRESIKV
jgi:hypothetical protein